jgi:hypothetical protein
VARFAEGFALYRTPSNDHQANSLHIIPRLDCHVLLGSAQPIPAVPAACQLWPKNRVDRAHPPEPGSILMGGPFLNAVVLFLILCLNWSLMAVHGCSIFYENPRTPAFFANSTEFPPLPLAGPSWARGSWYGWEPPCSGAHSPPHGLLAVMGYDA